MFVDRDGARWATVREAARLVRVREDLVRQWKARGKVRSRSGGGRVMVRMEDVWAAERAMFERSTRRPAAR